MLDFLRRFFQRRKLKPVSEALNVEAGALKEQLLNAIAALDSVHKDGTLPNLPVKQALLVDMHGYFLSTIQGEAIEIVVSLINPHIELTVVHEIGHFLDLKALDRSAEWASVNSPVLAPWRETVKASQAVQSLRHFMDPSVTTMQETLVDNHVVEYPIDKSYVGYLLKAEELWARSYSQFVATKSSDPELLSQMDKERERPLIGPYYEKQWSSADFQPIMAEVEAVFRRLGWMQ